jgi:SPP1 gp7 family putative phage head morphogenesis protein
MHAEVLAEIEAPKSAYPAMDSDEPVPTVAIKLKGKLPRLIDGAEIKFSDSAQTLAERFAGGLSAHVDRNLKRQLKNHGWLGDLGRSRFHRNIFDTAIKANVELIQSIPLAYHADVAELVNQSIKNNWPISKLTQEIKNVYGVTYRRAALISRDQTNKVTSALARARHIELGIEEALWWHSGVPHEPRKTHVAMHGQRFDIARGMWDAHEQRYVHPSELVNCRCASVPILPKRIL